MSITKVAVVDSREAVRVAAREFLGLNYEEQLTEINEKIKLLQGEKQALISARTTLSNTLGSAVKAAIGKPAIPAGFSVILGEVTLKSYGSVGWSIEGPNPTNQIDLTEAR